MSIFSNINGNDPFGALQGEGAESADFPSGFQNSPFGPFWETAEHFDEHIIEETPINVEYHIKASFKKKEVVDLFNKETVADNVIKLYLTIENSYPIKYGELKDLRDANIRYSNILSYVGIVLGDDIYREINKDVSRQDFYVDKLARDFIEDASQLDEVKSIINRRFIDYMKNKRSDIFKLGLVGQLIQEELKKDLQEFWKPVLQSLANEVRKLKLEDEKYWQPYNKNGELKSEDAFTPIISGDVRNFQEFALNSIKSLDAIDSLILDYTGLKKIEGVTQFKSDNNKSLLEEALSEVYSFFKAILGEFKERLIAFLITLSGKFYEANAFLVGLINGVIELIAGLIDAVGMMAGLISGDAKFLKEAIQKEFAKLKEDGFYTYLFKELSEFFEDIGERYKTSQSRYAIMKKLGEDIIGIADLILGIYFGYKIGITVLSRVRVVLKDLDKRVDVILKNVYDEFKKIRRKARADWMSKNLFRLGSDGETIRNASRLLKRPDDGFFNVLAHGDGKRFIIDGRKYNADEFASLLLKNGYQKGDPIRLIVCYAGAKPNGPASKLAKILNATVLAATDKIALNNLNEFVIKNNGVFETFNP